MRVTGTKLSSNEGLNVDRFKLVNDSNINKAVNTSKHVVKLDVIPSNLDQGKQGGGQRCWQMADKKPVL